MSMKLATYQDNLMAKSLKQRDEIEGFTKDKLKDLISFTAEEMLA